MESSKEISKKQPVVVNGILMKPDYLGTVMSMKVGEVKRFDRIVLPASRIRVLLARLHKNNPNRRYSCSAFDNDSYCIVTRLK